MLTKIKNLLAPPVFDDAEKTNLAQYINILLNISIIALILLIPSGTFASEVALIFGILAIIFIGLRFLLYSGKVALASFLFIIISWSIMTYLAWIGNGFQDIGIYTYIIFIFLARLLGGTRNALILTIMSIASIWLLYYAEVQGIINPVEDSITAAALAISAVMLLITAIIVLTVTNLEKTIVATKKSEEKIAQYNKELLETQKELKEYVEAIEETSRKAKLHATRLETIAKVSQRIALNQNLDTLLPEITLRISEDFDFYHVGIFLLSKNNKFAQLKAANSPGGRRMLARRHQLEIGQVGIVGRTAGDGQTRIALDVGQSAVYFDNPDLPETHSEMALALKVRDNIIGVLDVQSKKKTAFTKEDAKIFETLANQIAIAIENAHQIEITKGALKEAQEISRQYTQQAWSQLASTQHQLNYRYIDEKIEIISKDKNINNTEMITFPVKVRDEIIGYLDIRKNKNLESLKGDHLDLVEAIANRTGLALDNARLLVKESRKAGRERKVTEITTKIRSEKTPQAMIDIALAELKEALGVTKIELITTETK